MCGILGVLNTEKQADIHSFKRGLKLLYRRGPDAHGVEEFANGRTLLGHTRLSIVDTSAAGNQPLSNHDKSLWITFNGEVYNYLELRRELEQRGFQFRTRTDTEVVLHAYEEWGHASLTRLRGIYAFGIYSVPNRSLFLARDQTGVKPLYYLDNGWQFGFASTPSALLAALDRQRVIDERSLMSYLWYGNTPGENCIYQDICKLPPGTALFIQGEKREKINVFSLEQEIKPIESQTSLEEELKSLLQNSLRLNQRSDVPIGYFLSGGLDSTLICLLAQAESSITIPTFSIGFECASSDETQYALRASSRIGSSHTVAVLTYEKALGQLWDVASAFDEPFHINALLPFTFLCKLVRESGYKVAISGDGADELFGGYLWHTEWWKKDTESRLGRFNSIRNRLGLRAPSLEKYLKIFLESSGGVAKHIMDNLDTSTSDQYITGQLDANYFRGTDSLKYPLLVDQGCFLPDHCLPKVDRCSMHYGLEVRVPFLDQELFKFTKQLASHNLISNYQRKFLLKKTFKHQLDGIELDRKKGFSSPLSEWWEMGLKRIAEYSFANSGFFQSSDMLKNLVKISKSNKDTMSLITLFSLALWADCWLEDQKLSSHDLLMSL